MTIEEKYAERVAEKSDINELLPHLRKYSKGCKHITEMGVRSVVSTYAFLVNKPKKFIGYDLGRYAEVDVAKELAEKAGIEFEFKQEDVLKAEIEQTDFLFIDTFHTATQLDRELKLHAGKVNKFIAFHDTNTYWEVGEPSNEAVADKATNCGRGMKFTLEPFLQKNPEWKIVFRTEINNGLIIIQRND
jgi:hypothetical protein